MWYRIRHNVQHTGLLIAALFLLNGVAFSPATAADGPSTAVTTTSSFQSPWQAPESDSATKAALDENYGRLPLSFEENRGQADGAVEFLSRGKGYTLYLAPGETVLNLRRASAPEAEPRTLSKGFKDESRPVETRVIRLKNIGANPDPKITGIEKLPGKSNYFIGSDPAKWRTNVPNYAKVKVEDVYPGIDLVYYGNRRQLEYDWIVAPGADPGIIRFAVESTGELRVDSRGNLLLDEKGKVRLNRPLIYQEQDGHRTEIAGVYVIPNKGVVGIQVDKYDPALPLVIDPILVYSTYIGGSADEYVYAGTIDPSGNAYVAGGTNSVDLPLVNAAQESITGNIDAYVVKLNPAGSALVYSTYLGGFDSDIAYGITADASGNAYIVGTTNSSNFPTVNQYETNDAYIDAFVVKLTPAGDIAYSTYLGGNDDEYGRGIAVDASGNAYVTGETSSTNFPTTQNPSQASNGGGAWDAYVTKFNSTGDTLIYSTYLGGSDTDVGFAVALDSSGNAYVSGITVSTDFPTENPFQASNGGGAYDAFVTKFNSTGSTVIYSTYLGGSDADYGYAIDVDGSGNAYVAGGTYSTNFPTENPFQATSGGGGNCDAFVTKLNTAGNGLVYSTYLGGSG